MRLGSLRTSRLRGLKVEGLLWKASEAQRWGGAYPRRYPLGDSLQHWRRRWSSRMWTLGAFDGEWIEFLFLMVGNASLQPREMGGRSFADLQVSNGDGHECRGIAARWWCGCYACHPSVLYSRKSEGLQWGLLWVFQKYKCRPGVVYWELKAP